MSTTVMLDDSLSSRFVAWLQAYEAKGGAISDNEKALMLLAFMAGAKTVDDDNVEMVRRVLRGEIRAREIKAGVTRRTVELKKFFRED